MLSFLPILSSDGELALENAIKYFLVQRWASIIFFLGYFLSVRIFKSFIYLIVLGILLKLGAAPLHGWFISILKTCSMWALIILSTLQKLIPLLIIRNFFLVKGVVYAAIFLTSLVVFYSLPGAVGLIKILALSSLRNLIWFLASLWTHLKLLSIFISIYFLLLLGVRFSYSAHTCTGFQQLNRIPPLEKILRIFVLMSLGGLPPLLGFLGKLIVLKNIIFFISFAFILLLIYTALIILYHYISRMYFSLTFVPLMKISPSTKYFAPKKYFYLTSLVGFNVFLLGLI